jgi:signal transduction histidine kinase/ActR/RegA family two-component response regulator
MLATGLVHAADVAKSAETAGSWVALVVAVVAAIVGIGIVTQVRGRLRRAGELVAEARNELRRSEGQNRDLVRDISERKRVENVLCGDVEQAAGDRRNLEEQLRNAQRMEAIGLLATGVANDFNNLLAIITSHGETHMSKLAAQDPRRRNVEQMITAAKQAATLTHRLLAFSRLQALPTVLVDFNHLVIDLDKNRRHLVGDNIDLVMRLAPDLGHVQGDPGQMNQVLANLIVNARESMPDGGSLTIETANVELDEIYTRLHMAVKPGWCVMLSVADTGRGMDSATQARIFEPFFGPLDTGSASGLGLATVYGIVKQCGGNIWFSSAPGKGTTFKVYLPRVDGAVVCVPGEGRAVGANGAKTILLVEDEIDVRELINEMLVSDGYRVIEAGNGEEALAAYQANPGAINLIMTDIVMPRMNGPELAEQIDKLSLDVKILYMSGYMSQTIVDKGVVDPALMFLEKPFTAALLLRKVREALDHPKAGA